MEQTFASFEAATAHLDIDLGQDNFLELPDLALAIEAIGDKIVVVLDKYKSGYECAKCKGTGKIRSTLVADAIKTCDKCDGRGHVIFIPDQAKSIATTGVVVSIGPDVTRVKPYHRVICTPHSGTSLPMKGNIEIKIYHQHEPLAYLHNLNVDGTYDERMIDEHRQIRELDTTKFVELDTPLPEGSGV